MTSVKQITDRASKKVAMLNIAKNNEVLLVSDNETDEVMIDISKNKRKVVVQNKAKGSNLNLVKHFKKRIECCNKELVHIQKKKGSGDKKQVYIEFQTGMFEVLKKCMVKYMKEKFDVNQSATKDPKVETYGANKAEERYFLDLEMNLNNEKHEIKVIIYNTICCMMIQGQGQSVDKFI